MNKLAIWIFAAGVLCAQPPGNAARGKVIFEGKGDCLSCHRVHATEYKHMVPFPTTTELCVKCHERFKR